MVILDDLTPICGHDPAMIAYILHGIVKSFGCSGVLLDFQRPGVSETVELSRYLVEALPCLVGVTEFYGKDLDCPLFLTPPLRTPPEEYLQAWQGRELWLELTSDAEEALVTESGCRIAALPGQPLPNPVHQDKALLCHYHWSFDGQQVRLLIQRTREDLQGLLKMAADFGVTRGLGLYQQLK